MNACILLCLIILCQNLVHGDSIIGQSGSKEFYVISATQNYQQTVQGCVNLGMRIAIPETQTEFDDLLRIFDSTGYTHANFGRAYTGITKAGGRWGSHGYSIKWFPAQPSGDGTCSEIIRGLIASEVGHHGLNDLSCEHLRSAICEKAIIPQTTQAPIPRTDNTAALTQCESDKATLAAEILQINKEIEPKFKEIQELHSEIEAKTAKINQQTQRIAYLENILENQLQQQANP